MVFCFLLLFFFFSPLPPLTESLNQEGLYLLQVKKGLADPDGFFASWNPHDATPCNWNGIGCDPLTHRVNSVAISDSTVSGPFPPSICRLPSLSNLSFYNSYINSSLSTVDFSACRSLRHLDLSQNLFVGQIPATLPEIPNLRYLNLSGNNFSGGIPPTFGRFRQLESLILSDNLLNGTVPSFLGNLTTLKVLLLAYNPFLPSRLSPEFGNLTDLENLWLTDCNLFGEIPASLARLKKVKNFDLSVNKLTGPFPSWLNELTSVVQVELYANSLSGELPAKMSNMTALRRFDAAANKLEGTIPDELCGLPLESLNLYDNRLTGSLPESITQSLNLYELRLFSNRLNGSLPRGLGSKSPLKHLDVSSNGFSGEIPASVCSKGELEELLLINNAFSGSIPVELGECRSLTRVRLRSNRLTGEVPAKLWGLPHVYLLDLVENSLSGNVSSMISGAYNLSSLVISKNEFNGSIPSEIGSLKKLLEFSGDGNRFSGPIPSSLGQMVQLGLLDLRNNELSGEIPKGIESWRRLNQLNLANNNLSGEIPYEIGNLPVLNYLDLSGNDFSGEIPLELQNLKLNVLNLSNNHLSGAIPPLYAKAAYTGSFLGNPGLCHPKNGLCPHGGPAKGQGYLWILRSIFMLAGIVFVVGVVWFFLKYQKIKKTRKGLMISKWKSFHKLGFSEFEVLGSLSEDNVIGSGASGKVYKVVLSNGEVVAVKKLWGVHKMDAKGPELAKDAFVVEVETLGKIRHKNIVRLWCCCNGKDCKLLVYEYMPNGSLGDFLHNGKGGLLDWPTRYRIAMDAAEGLSYLHHDCVPSIVHRDVKSNNILLDGDFSARIADFGLAKFLQTVGKGEESMSVIAGSYGYIAPEYAYTLRVNEKSDIYSFGVVILELVTGKLPNDPEFGEKDIVKWVTSTLDQKGVDSLLDPKLDTSYREEICKVLNIGLCCTSSLPMNRPTMRRVVKMLQAVNVEAENKHNPMKETQAQSELP